MLLQSIGPDDVITATFTLIFVIIGIFVGLGILVRYFATKRKDFLIVGLAWICLCSPWWSAPFSFLTYLATGEVWEIHVFFLIGNIFIPVALICWIYACAENAFQKWKKPILIAYSLICVIFTIAFIVTLIVDVNSIGTFDGTFDARYLGFTRLFQIFAVASALITGFLFVRQSFSSDVPKVKWKGRFLLLAFIIFAISAVIDSALPLSVGGVIAIRLLLIFSAISYYFGWLLPDRILQLLTK